MERPVRIGLAGLDHDGLLAGLRGLPSRPEVHGIGPVYEGTEALLALRPDVLFVPAADDADAIGEMVGALRLLLGLLPGLALVVVAPSAREVQIRPACERIGARLLLTPFQPAELASALDHALLHSDRPTDDVFLDLAHGFADEINNPLLFLMGHLQLLQTQLDPAAQDERDQLAAALAGARRIHDTVERVRLLARAAAGPRAHDPIDLAAEVAAALARHGRPGQAVPILAEPDGARFVGTGDGELLRAAVDLVVQVASELQALGSTVHFVLTRLPGVLRLRLQLDGPGFDDWRLPRTYEPYYLNRLLRGSSQGLALFVVRTVFHAHRGQATARRLPGGAVAIDLLLPAG